MSSGFNNGREPTKLIRDILKSELGLDDDRIMLSNSKLDIDPGPGIYIVISYLSGRSIGNNNYIEAVSTGMQETQEVTMRHLIQIDIMSADETARMQKEQIFQALFSAFAAQTQDLNGMQISRMPGDFTDVSSLEETKILNRYVMTIAVTSLYSRTKPLSIGYYDKFPVTINNDTNTGTITIEAETAPSF